MNASVSTQASAKTERLFLALWPDDNVRRRLVDVSADARIDGRRVPSENLHLTLVFLGAVDATRRSCVEQAAANVRATPVEFAIEQVEWRPRTSMVWAGPRETPVALVALVRSLKQELQSCGWAPESRPFRAHVTIARAARRGQSFEVHVPIRWRARRFSLVVSRRLPRGSRYEVAGSWDL